MGTQTHIERELKLRLADESAWAEVRAALGTPKATRRQVNTYFDTPDGRLRVARNLMVRVREAGGAVRLQVKDRIEASDGLLTSRERQAELTAAQWEAVHRGRTALTGLHVPLCVALFAEVGAPLHPLGSMVNTRDVFDLSGGYVCELDRTELPGGGLDFEIEIELVAPAHTLEGARAALEAVAGPLDTTPSSPKYARFLDALDACTSLD